MSRNTGKARAVVRSPRGVPGGGVAMNSTTFEIETVLANTAERVRAIRFRLPGQAVMERIELARVAYGPLYTIGLIQERVSETLPIRIGYVRSTVMEPIAQYSRLIPDEVLLKYDDAARSGLFARFWVVTPTYYRAPQADPLIVAEVAGTRLCAVIARWDDV